MTSNPIEQFEASAQLFKALAHPARLAILDILRDGEQCVCHMEAVLGFRQAYLSQQLAVLREAGILQDRREGWNIYYRIVREDVLNILHTVHSSLPEQIPSAKAHSCDCPKCKRKDAPAAEPQTFFMANQAG
ncbi:MAG TPA: ArsR family transcriptional regulator [Anaerolineaceae bacterium]|jgi:ArsR family transcriptional regulator|nr:ArsR family transcriptional regulator [Anaerolineaceae bacterium]